MCAFEPQSALIAPRCGLADIEQIAKAALSYVKPEGWLLFEHGYEQASDVQTLLKRLGYRNVESVRDLSGHERVTLGQM